MDENLPDRNIFKRKTADAVRDSFIGDLEATMEDDELLSDDFQEFGERGDELSSGCELGYISVVQETVYDENAILQSASRLWIQEGVGGESPVQVESHASLPHLDVCFPYSVGTKLSGEGNEAAVVMSSMKEMGAIPEGSCGREREEGGGVSGREGEGDELAVVGVDSEERVGERERIEGESRSGLFAHNLGTKGGSGEGAKVMEVSNEEQWVDPDSVGEQEEDIEEFLESMGLRTVEVKDRDEWMVKTVKYRKYKSETNIRELEQCCRKRGISRSREQECKQ